MLQFYIPQPIASYRGPELVKSKVLESSDSWLLEYGEREDDDEGQVEEARDPPALVGGVHPDAGEGGVELHMTPGPGIVQIGSGQEDLVRRRRGSWPVGDRPSAPERRSLAGSSIRFTEHLQTLTVSPGTDWDELTHLDIVQVPLTLCL